jgi:hypothetical protein
MRATGTCRHVFIVSFSICPLYGFNVYIILKRQVRVDFECGAKICNLTIVLGQATYGSASDIFITFSRTSMQRQQVPHPRCLHACIPGNNFRTKVTPLSFERYGLMFRGRARFMRFPCSSPLRGATWSPVFDRGANRAHQRRNRVGVGVPIRRHEALSWLGEYRSRLARARLLRSSPMSSARRRRFGRTIHHLAAAPFYFT